MTQATLNQLFLKILKIDTKKNQKLSLNDTHNWDSIGHVRLMLAIEQKFNIKIPNELYQELSNYQKILNYILKQQ